MFWSLSISLQYILVLWTMHANEALYISIRIISEHPNLFHFMLELTSPILLGNNAT